MSSWRAVVHGAGGRFPMVMATGIVAGGLADLGRTAAATVLTWLGCAAFAVLVLDVLVRIARGQGGTVDRARSFELFAVGAAAEVLATRFTDVGAALVFLVFGALWWLVLGYLVPVLATPTLARADGSWFLIAVGAQAVVVAVTALPAPLRDRLGAVAVFLWCVGVMLYLVVAVLVAVRLLRYRVRGDQLAPSYWISMGATGICALGGVRLLHVSVLPAPVLVGISVLLLAFGTWLVPLLVAATTCWVRSRWPLRYVPGLWSIVFPVGMYGLACRTLGAALRVAWLGAVGGVVIWVGAVAWVLVAVGGLGSLAGWARRTVGGHG